MFQTAVSKFQFEKLTVYERGLDLAGKIHKLAGSSSQKGEKVLALLEEKGLLLPAAIAEAGVYAGSPARAHAYRMARGECLGLVPLLEVAHREEMISEANCEALAEEIEQLSKMLTNLVHSLEQEKPAREKK